jgi:hypothetical protein
MHDAELDELRAKVDCRTVLENAGWSLDARASTRLAAKYRGGAGEIVIVTHDGRGWFDPLNDARGDVIALAQRVWGGSIGHARKALRPLAGIAPELRGVQGRAAASVPLDAPKAWMAARKLVRGSLGWRYLTQERQLPADAIDRAVLAGVLREGIQGTVWALHRGTDGVPCGWEMRGPNYKGFSKGGDKALFWLADPRASSRVAVAESWIDALSLGAIEGWPDGTAYVSTGGGFGPATSRTLGALLVPGTRLVAATDRGTGGELLADRLSDIATTAGIGFGRLRPVAKDWNQQLCCGGVLQACAHPCGDLHPT